MRFYTVNSEPRVLIFVAQRSKNSLEGVASYVLKLCQALERKGVFYVIVYNARDRLYDLCLEKNLNIILMDYVNSKSIKFEIRFFWGGILPQMALTRGWFTWCADHPTFKLCRFFKYWKIKRRLKEIIDQNQINIIHAQEPSLLRFIDKKWNLPILCHNHAYIPDWLIPKTFTPKQRFRKWYRDKRIFNFSKCDYVINVSNAAEQTAIGLYKVPKEKNSLIYYPVDILPSSTSRHDLRKQLSINEHDIVVISIGRITKAKGVESFGNQAVAMKAIRANIKFLFVGQGRDEKYTAEIKKKYGDEVSFLGYRKDIGSIMEMSDVYLGLSERESFGLTLVEAMHCGCPIIGWDMPGYDEIVRNGIDGYLVEYGNDVKVTEALNKIIEDETLYKSLSDNCIIRAKVFSSEKHVEKLLKLYLSLITKEN